MKILRLEIYNLASLAAIDGQPQVIDFENSVLADAGLTAITGATGAGKSTILDALCLALFDQVPRLRGIAQENKILDQQGEHILVSDRRNMLTRGAISAHSFVQFKTLDGKRYEAQWSVHRARKRANGALQKISRKLINLDDNSILADQINEVGNLIQSAIGMNFQQFTRAVLLAQSEFSAFLKANDAERANLLECLTDTAIYSRLGALAYAQQKKTSDAVQQIQQHINHHSVLSASERQQLNSELANADQQRQQLRQQQAQWREQLIWQKQCETLQQQRQACQKKLEEQQQLWQQKQADNLQFQQWQRLHKLRELWPQQQAQQQQQAKQQQHSARLQQQLQQAKQQQQSQKQRLDDAIQAVNAQLDIAQQQRDTLDRAQQLEHSRDTLADRYRELKKNLDEQNVKIQQQQQHYDQQEKTRSRLAQALQDTPALARAMLSDLGQLQRAIETIPQLQQLYQSAEQQQNDRRHSQIQLEQQQKQQQLALQHWQQLQQQHGQPELLNAQQQQQQQALQQLDALFLRTQQQQQWCRTAQQQQQQAEDNCQQQQQLEQQIAQQQQQEQREKQLLLHIEQQLRDLQSTLAQQQQLTTQSAEALRHTLQPDQPCMVCGSTTHPYVDAHGLALAKQLLAHSEQLVQQTLEKQAQQRQKHQQQYDALLLSRHQHQQHQQQQRVLTEQQQQHQQLAQPDWPDRNLSTLDQLLAQQQSEQQQLKQQIQSLQAIALQFQSAEQQLAQHNQQLSDCQQQHSQHQHAWQLWTEKTSALMQTVLHCLPTAQQQHWTTAWQAENFALLLAECGHVQPQLQQLQQQIEQHLADQSALQQLTQDLAAAHTALHMYQQSAQKLAQDLDSVRAEGLQCRQQLDACLAACPIRIDGQAAKTSAQLRQHLDDARQHAEQQQREQQQADDQIKKVFQDLHLEQARADRDLQHSQQRLDHLNQQIAQERAHHAHLSEQQLLNYRQLDDSAMAELGQMLSLAEQALKDANHADQQCDLLQQQHQHNRPSHLQHGLRLCAAELQQQLDQLQPTIEKAEQQWAEYRGKLNADEHIQKKQQKLIAELHVAQTEHTRWSRLADPIACQSGAKFKKIAQSYQLDLLLQHANQQLAALSPRYRLLRAPDSLGLWVVDLDMGEECRSVYSLSGGESFLLSLALALALSHLAAGQAHIESLFIDEGFGTLDPESLQLVMDALDQLQGQGRKVTIITHVQEMHERIPVQIRVERLGAGRSQIQLIG